MAQQEQWLPVPGFDGYEVSSLGRVVSHRRGTARELKGGTTHDGYRFLTVRRDGKAFSPRVHVLVAAAFIGPRPDGLEIRHGDGDKLNNSAGNLSYGTRSENILDQVVHGTHNQARKTHCKHGHEFTPGNTYLAGTRRQCRACRRAATRAYAIRQQFAAANVPTERAA